MKTATRLGLLTVLLAMMAKAVLSSSATDAATIKGDRGGLIRDYLNRWAKYKGSGEKVIIDGACLSACTMFTSLPNVCITGRIILGFHKGSSARATRTMLTMLPEKIRALVEKEGEMADFDSEEYTLLFYADLKDLLPTCEGIPTH